MKKAKKMKKKRHERLGNMDDTKTMCNKNVGDTRFTDNYKIDYQRVLFDNEREKAN